MFAVRKRLFRHGLRKGGPAHVVWHVGKQVAEATPEARHGRRTSARRTMGASLAARRGMARAPLGQTEQGIHPPPLENPCAICAPENRAWRRQESL